MFPAHKSTAHHLGHCYLYSCDNWLLSKERLFFFRIPPLPCQCWIGDMNRFQCQDGSEDISVHGQHLTVPLILRPYVAACTVWSVVYGVLESDIVLLRHRNCRFPGEPGLAGVYWNKAWRRWWRQLDYSSDVSTYVVPRTHTGFGDRPFQVAGPRLWNSLSASLRQSDTAVGQFKKLLKTQQTWVLLFLRFNLLKAANTFDINLV